MIGTMFVQDLAIFLATAFVEYKKARENSSAYAKLLSEELIQLRKEYDYIRIVAHSLGNLHLIKALEQIPINSLPNEVHMCGAAVTEEELTKFMDMSTHSSNNMQLYHYWSERDYLLYYVFQMVSLGDCPIGSMVCSGKETNYHIKELKQSRVESINVSEHFDFYVHNKYGQMFHKFAKAKKVFVE